LQRDGDESKMAFWDNLCDLILLAHSVIWFDTHFVRGIIKAEEWEREKHGRNQTEPGKGFSV
jgi:hypothetical protein